QDPPLLTYVLSLQSLGMERSPLAHLHYQFELTAPLVIHTYSLSLLSMTTASLFVNQQALNLASHTYLLNHLKTSYNTKCASLFQDSFFDANTLSLVE